MPEWRSGKHRKVIVALKARLEAESEAGEDSFYCLERFASLLEHRMMSRKEQGVTKGNWLTKDDVAEALMKSGLMTQKDRHPDDPVNGPRKAAIWAATALGHHWRYGRLLQRAILDGGKTSKDIAQDVTVAWPEWWAPYPRGPFYCPLCGTDDTVKWEQSSHLGFSPFVRHCYGTGCHSEFDARDPAAQEKRGD